MPSYLVAAERPYGDNEDIIVVTNDVEGFGPGVLAEPGIQTMEADTPQMAGYRYARQHKLANIRVLINLPNRYEEWHVCTNEACKVDTEISPVWESEVPIAGEAKGK